MSSFKRLTALLDIRLGLVAILLASLAGCSKKGVEARWHIGPQVGTLDLLAVGFIDKDTGWAVGGIDPKGSGGL
ncbi:MAG TPA: hypothetical protein VEZ90_05160, partial [Blastocatellia bacterium]|nr:hypothetical protein [Blastocatellia bacterium]